MKSKFSLKSIVPPFLRVPIKKRVYPIIRGLKSPKMLWGYENYSGEYCPKTRISDTVFFYHPEAIMIADNVFVWHYTILDGTGGLEIGEGTQIGAG